MKSRLAFWAVVLLLLALVGWQRWEQGKPRRQAIIALERLHSALSSNRVDQLSAMVIMAGPLLQKTTAEQHEFIRKAVIDEISPEGIAALERGGQFGPLKDIFPEEAARWTEPITVNINDCVAFRMERNGIRAEIVMFRETSKEATTFRIIRCNNVKQMAATTDSLQTAKRNQE